MINRNISERNSKIDCLDGVRGLAALIVVLSHTSNAGMSFIPFLDFRGTGKSGVFLFFLLSAFLLTTPFLREGKGLFSVDAMSHYWQRRFFRIYPLYTLYLLFALLSTYFLSFAFGKVGVGIPFALDWLEFIEHLSLVKGYGVTWSIAVEFKFYFILPFLVWLVLLFRSRLNGFGMAVLFLIFMTISQVVFPEGDSKMNDPRLLPYIPIFVVGAFLSVLQESIKKQRAGEINVFSV